MNKFAIAFALLLGSAMPAFADEAPAEPAPAPAAQAVEDDDPVVCHNEPLTGSRLPRRVCIRKSEREAMRKDAARAISNAQRKTPSQGGN